MLALLVCRQAAQAQLQPDYTLKFDIGAAALGEYRFSYEWKLRANQYLYTSASYFVQERTIDDPIEEERETNLGQLWRQIRTDWNKFLYTSAGYFYRDFTVDRERVQGPIVRFGLRQYFLTEHPPLGPYLYLGATYGFIFAESYSAQNERLESLALHRPGLGTALGYQHLFGIKNNFTVEGFAGMEYAFLIEQGPVDETYTWQNLPTLQLYAGIGVGFAFRRKNRHW